MVPGLVGHDGVDDEVDGVGVGKRGAWFRKLDAFHVHAGGAVDSLGDLDGAHERAVAAGHRQESPGDQRFP